MQVQNARANQLPPPQTMGQQTSPRGRPRASSMQLGREEEKAFSAAWDSVPKDGMQRVGGGGPSKPHLAN